MSWHKKPGQKEMMYSEWTSAYGSCDNDIKYESLALRVFASRSARYLNPEKARASVYLCVVT